MATAEHNPSASDAPQDASGQPSSSVRGIDDGVAMSRRDLMRVASVFIGLGAFAAMGHKPIMEWFVRTVDRKNARETQSRQMIDNPELNAKALRVMGDLEEYGRRRCDQAISLNKDSPTDEIYSLMADKILPLRKFCDRYRDMDPSKASLDVLQKSTSVDMGVAFKLVQDGILTDQDVQDFNAGINGEVIQKCKDFGGELDIAYIRLDDILTSQNQSGRIIPSPAGNEPRLSAGREPHPRSLRTSPNGDAVVE